MKKIVVLITLLSLFSCTKDAVNITASLLDTIPIHKFYANEIFTDVNLKLYGQWQFLYIFDDAGIIAGPGKINPTYNYLEIRKYGIYGKIKDNQVIESGEIGVTKQNATEFQITLKPDKAYPQANETWYDIAYTGKDSLRLRDASVGCGVLYNVYRKQN
jgi:hypothetical protein